MLILVILFKHMKTKKSKIWFFNEKDFWTDSLAQFVQKSF